MTSPLPTPDSPGLPKPSSLTHQSARATQANFLCNSNSWIHQESLSSYYKDPTGRFLHASALPAEIWTWSDGGGWWEALLELPCPQATSQGDGAASSSIRNRCARGLFPGPIKIYFGLEAETKEGKVCNNNKKNPILLP